VSTTAVSEPADFIGGGLKDVATDGILLSSHLRWELQQVLSRVRPEDLSTGEIAALLVVLTPVDFRAVGVRGGRP
jgi:hypothetical protein